ncbi:MAG: STAS domain-containing protein [Chitinophagales bacterium]
MEYSIESRDNASIITMEGSLLADVQSRDILQKVTELIQNEQVNFVMEMSELKFINSSGLGMLLTCLTKARKAGGDVILANMPEQVSNLLVITKLNSIFNTADSLEEGLEKFNS